ncbi:MAG: alpha/beta fold hydrolase [Mycobacteriaceae bacterium]
MELAHTVHGSDRSPGPTLVLVHGLGHTQRAWDPVLAQLTPYRRVVTVDLPGHGESPPLPEGPDPVGRIVDAVDAMLDRLAPDEARAHVAGNSLGGLVALQLAVRNRVATATALSPAGFASGRWDTAYTAGVFRASRALARRQQESLPRLARNRVTRSALLFPFFGKPWKVDPEAALADARGLLDNAMIDPVLEEGLGTAPAVAHTDVPVTIAWGRRDLILPVHQARNARRLFPDATHVVLPGLGHVCMSDAPERVGLVLLARG